LEECAPGSGEAQGERKQHIHRRAADAEKTQQNTGLGEWGRRIVILRADTEEAESAERRKKKGTLRQKAVFSPDR
jgi:hypothetical protein